MDSANLPPPRERRRESRSGAIGRFMDGFFTVVRWLDRRFGGVWAEMGAYLVLGFLLVLAMVAAFLLVGFFTAGEGMQRVDVAILRALRRLESPLLDVLALLGTAIGSSIAAYLVLAISAVVFWRSGHRLSALLLLVSLAGTRALIGVLKGMYDRPRPGLVGERVHALGMTFEFPQSASFPSGHAITAVAAFGTLAYLAARVAPGRAARRGILLGALVTIGVIGFSRMYFAVHYPSDVVAGILAGLAWGTICALTLEVAMYASRRHHAELPREDGLDEGLRPVRDSLRSGADDPSMEPQTRSEGTS